MFDLQVSNAASYLEWRGVRGPFTRVAELGGGVSNCVVLVESPAGRWVLKQALGKLRVEQDWFSGRERIFRESAAIQALAPHLPRGSLPEVLFEDRENCLFAMTAAPAGARSWKSLLMEGAIDPGIAESVGRMLATVIRISWRAPAWEGEFGDQTVFEQLRIDPYYRSTAMRHPALAERFEGLIEDSSRRRVSLVHGDWSPKNFLVTDQVVMAIDFEVIHFGDPSFDSAFLLNHLLLKSFYRPCWAERYAGLADRFWQALAPVIAMADWFEAATIRHLGCLLVARVDGKSPVEYLKEEALRERVRSFARDLILHPPETVAAVFHRL